MVDATRFLGAWLRAGEGIGWLAAGTMTNSLYRMPLVYLFLTCVFCYSCSFLFVVFCMFVFFFCSHWSLVDVPLIFFCPADHVPDWQPRVLLGMVEARSVNVKKTTTKNNNIQHVSVLATEKTTVTQRISHTITSFRYAGAPIATRVFFFSFFPFFFVYLEIQMSLFPSILSAFSLYIKLESTSYVISFWMVFFLPCDHGLDF